MLKRKVKRQKPLKKILGDVKICSKKQCHTTKCFQIHEVTAWKVNCIKDPNIQ